MSADVALTLRQEINDFYNSTAKGDGGWRRVGRILGTSGGAAIAIADGSRAPTPQHIMRWAKSDHSCLVVARPCPTCLAERGEVVNHADDLDCHGKSDAVVVMVKPSAQQAIELIDLWLADGSGHDEEVWPTIEKALRLRRPAKPARTRPPAYRPMLSPEIKQLVEQYGVDIEQAVIDAAKKKGYLHP